MAVSQISKRPVGGWKYEHLFALPDDGKRYEIIEGELYELPSPSIEHAAVVMNIITLLLPVATSLGGRVFTAPLDVRFPGADPVQPDILVLLPALLAATRDKRTVEGAPDLVVEVVSPGNPRHDRVRKRAVYARGGVPEYWLVEREVQSIEVLALANGVYETHVLATGETLATSTVLPDLSFPASAAFR